MVILNVDDGSIFDPRIAKLFEKYGFTGVFYIAPFYSKYPMMSVGEIKKLVNSNEAYRRFRVVLNGNPEKKSMFLAELGMELLPGRLPPPEISSCFDYPEELDLESEVPAESD